MHQWYSFQPVAIFLLEDECLSIHQHVHFDVSYFIILSSLFIVTFMHLVTTSAVPSCVQEWICHLLGQRVHEITVVITSLSFTIIYTIAALDVIHIIIITTPIPHHKSCIHSHFLHHYQMDLVHEVV